jgi:DNA-binding protein H-NS
MNKDRRDETEKTIGQIAGLVGKLETLRKEEQREYDALKAEFRTAKRESQWRPPAKRLKKDADTLEKKFTASAKGKGATAQRAAKPSPAAKPEKPGKSGGIAKLAAPARKPQGAKT